ncbi:MAG: hypothetical protein B6U86_02760 [Candidatus Altiarchaeales archaeon ex4484_43]|nr:MAG: hypothetical protein B6U86_02760 [Candidatus Altiarchaeales archaeon ex4484_43]
MAKLDIIESVHRTNIRRLIDEFGEDHESEIMRLYNTQREAEERSARITYFIPIFVYRTVREVLRKRYQEVLLLKDS